MHLLCFNTNKTPIKKLITKFSLIISFEAFVDKILFLMKRDWRVVNLVQFHAEFARSQSYCQLNEN